MRILAASYALWLIAAAAPSRRLNDEVNNYVPLNIAPHRVMRRSAVTGDLHLNHEDFNLEIDAFQQTFQLSLSPDLDTHRSDFKVIVHDGTGSSSEFDMSDRKYYKGRVNGDADSFATMRVATDGTIFGYFHHDGESYSVDPASMHFEDEQEFNHVIYRLSDHDYVNNGDIPTPHCGTMDAKNLNLDSEEEAGSSGRSRRAASAYVTGQTVCGVAMVVDSLFYTTIGGSDVGSTVDIITARFAHVQTLYTNNDIKISGDPQPMGIAIANLEIQQDTNNDPYNPTGTDFGQDGSEYLTHASSDPNGSGFENYCLVHIVTNQEFNDGLLGLAWVGSSGSTPGGVCQGPVNNGGSQLYTNTGFHTQTNFGARVPSTTTYLVMAHELGHNFGSSHDTETPASGGNHLMWPVSVDGSDTNNFIFSAQSVDSFEAVIAAKGGCFSESADPFCGNNVLETGEVCDCGTDQAICDEVDVCCSPNCALAAGASCSPRHFRDGACCTAGCDLETVGTKCREATECALAQTCNGSGECLDSDPVADHTQCGDTAAILCFSGECQRSVCVLFGLVETDEQGSDADACKVHCLENDTPTLTSNIQATQQADALDSNGDPIDVTTTDVFKVLGSACFQPSGIIGVCDENNDCVDAGGQTLFDDLENFLKNLSLEDVKNWLLRTDAYIPNYGWLAIAFGVLILLIVCCCCISNRCDAKSGIH
jgi:disintegrin and metalloproteinase domain-containing protein 10